MILLYYLLGQACVKLICFVFILRKVWATFNCNQFCLPEKLDTPTNLNVKSPHLVSILLLVGIAPSAIGSGIGYVFPGWCQFVCLSFPILFCFQTAFCYFISLFSHLVPLICRLSEWYILTYLCTSSFIPPFTHSKKKKKIQNNCI